MIAAPVSARVGNAALAEGRPPRSVVLFLWAAVPLLVLYAATRARTVTGEDSGELITAAYQLGVAHPPGYPLWILLTKVFQTVFAGLNPADAAALGSAITTAAAVGTLALVAFRVIGSAPAALFGAWLTGLAHEIWNHATIAEIYPLNLLIFAATLLLFLRWQEQPTARRLFVLSLVYGCGLANHPTFHLFLPLFAVAVICLRPAVLIDWRSVSGAILGLSAPHLAYLETWIAAARGPYVSWGVDPTVRSLVGHYLREIYSIAPEKTAWTMAKATSQLRIYTAFLSQNLSILGVVAGFIGLFLLVRRRRVFGGLTLSLALLGTLGLLFFIKFDLEREELTASRVFLMPGYLLLGLGVAVVTDVVFRGLAARNVHLRAGWALSIPLVLAITGYRGHDRSDYFWSNDYGHAILDGLPTRAVLLPGGDTSTFPLLYLQGCEKVRRDVIILDRSGTIERHEAMALVPERARPALAGAPREDLVNAVMTLSGRPLVTLRPERAPPELEVAFEPFGLGFIAVPARDKAAIEKVRTAREAFFSALRLRNEDRPTVIDYTSDLIQSHLAQARALNFFRLGKRDDALHQVERAAGLAEGIKETLNNLGSLLAENGLSEEAIKYFRGALGVRVDYQLARQNLVVVLRRMGANRQALEDAKIGALIDSRDGFFFNEATDLAKEIKDGEALSVVCAARMKAVPDDPTPHRLLGEWALEVQGSPELARAHFERAMAANPKDESSQRHLEALRSGSVERGELAGLSARADGSDEFEALLPPPLIVRRDMPVAERARRFGTGDEAHAAVPGAHDFQVVLRNLRQSSGDVVGAVGLPSEREPISIVNAPPPIVGGGTQPRDER